MSEIENPPAFPRSYAADGHNGMSLRDWFAGQALAGLCSTLTNEERWEIVQGIRGGKSMSKAAFMYADAMLADVGRRNKSA